MNDQIVHIVLVIEESKEREAEEGFADVIEKGWMVKEGANDDSRRKRSVAHFTLATYTREAHQGHQGHLGGDFSYRRCLARERCLATISSLGRRPRLELHSICLLDRLTDWLND